MIADLSFTFLVAIGQLRKSNGKKTFMFNFSCVNTIPFDFKRMYMGETEGK